MLIEDRITADSSLRVDTVELESERLIVNLAATTEGGRCPGCGVTSRRGHSYYHRNPVDLPIIGYGIRLRIRVRRFFCDCPHCPKCTIAEHFPDLLPYGARRTARRQRRLSRLRSKSVLNVAHDSLHGLAFR